MRHAEPGSIMHLYHLAKVESVESILEHGLDPGFSQSSLPAIFLAASPDIAENYRHMKDEGEFVILAVDMALIPLACLSPDNYELADLLREMDARTLEAVGLWEGAEWSDATWQQSLEICGQVACETVIPPPSISIHRHLSPGIVEVSGP